MDVIIIGAGASGLMAARELARKGKKVLVLEARNRPGGRIHTFDMAGCPVSCEGGAEFVHGNLEVTLKALKEAGINAVEQEGEFFRVHQHKWTQENSFLEYEDLLIEALRKQEKDISIAALLEKEFVGEKFQEFRKSLCSYVEGYYAGEPGKTSAKAFLNEWENEDGQQYRVQGGYDKMVQYLMEEVIKYGGIIQLSTIVKEIKWRTNHLETKDALNRVYRAAQAIISVPIGVWRQEENEESGIRFIPPLNEKTTAAHETGFGGAIKILLLFKDVFWENKDFMSKTGQPLQNMSFLISDMPVPTWWTQMPQKVPLLTGWLAGPQANRLKEANDETILNMAIDSISRVFYMSASAVREKLIGWNVFNWPADPFTQGGYSYSTLETSKAVKELMAPVEQTLYFAGDGFYDGPEMGTVESALVSGLRAANEILNS